jgi:hypothetical protein
MEVPTLLIEINLEESVMCSQTKKVCKQRHP